MTHSEPVRTGPGEGLFWVFMLVMPVARLKGAGTI